MNSLQERLDKHSGINGATGCKEWVKHCNASGYGVVWMDGKAVGSHRAAWVAANGAIPEGLHVLHRCDNRKCINPDHLFLGTNSDNVADKVSKNRQFRPYAKGEANRHAKLTTAKAQAIRIWGKTGLSNKKIADKFGVCIMTVSFIRNNKTWTHV